MIISRHLAGMSLMISAMLVLPIMDAISKILSTYYSVTPAQITFGRFLVQTIILTFIILFYFGVSGFIMNRFFGNLLRGVLIGGAVLLFFTAIHTMPLADSIAIFFTEPFILTFLSWFFLGETIGMRRIIALIIGFLGSLLIIQPSYDLFGFVALLPLGTAFLFAFYILLTKVLSVHDDPIQMQFASGLGGMLFLFLIILIGNHWSISVFSSPDIPDFGIRWLMLFCLGVLASFGHLVVVWAFKLSDAGVLAPFQYLEIVSATLLGYLIFGDFPDFWKWIGIFLIIGSGIYIFLRQFHHDRLSYSVSIKR